MDNDNSTDPARAISSEGVALARKALFEAHQAHLEAEYARKALEAEEAEKVKQAKAELEALELPTRTQPNQEPSPAEQVEQ
ncbi:MAG: hypothetical protein WCH42_07910 [Actinomycetes bacterium]